MTENHGQTILVLGATGYIGSRLVPHLVAKGHRVRCLVRDKRKLSGKSWSKDVLAFEGDVLEGDKFRDAFAGVDIVYYLVHSMASLDGNFEELDRRAAKNVADVSGACGIKRLIYLGGLGKKENLQSAHLRSRHEVGDILRESGVPVTEFRAAVIVGSGSLSFELIHHLVNRLPVMICPRWVYTRTQPIAVRDVLDYLAIAPEIEASSGKTIDIGGPEILTYGDMMKIVAKVLKLRRLLMPVPVLTPRLSSYWVNLVTPIPAQVARPLIEGLKYETVCESKTAAELFDIAPASIDTAVRRAVAQVATNSVESTWTSAASFSASPALDPSHLLEDVRVREISAPVESLFAVISSIGGDNGWYYGDWLWRLRGFLDKQVGGVGLRRGRRHPTLTSIGEALDFWRVEDHQPNARLLLRAEMKVWGAAWLDLQAEAVSESQSRYIQTARFYPRGLIGLLYWYTIYPIHAVVFRGLASSIAARAEGKYSSEKEQPSRQ